MKKTFENYQEKKNDVHVDIFFELYAKNNYSFWQLENRQKLEVLRKNTNFSVVFFPNIPQKNVPVPVPSP